VTEQRKINVQQARRIGLKIGLVIVLVGAAVRVFLHFYPWQTFVSNARVLDEVSYCLGFFDTTRADRIRGRMGDGADELARMDELARYHTQMLRKFELTASDFGPTVLAGRKDAHDALEKDVLNLLFHYGKPLENWTKIANRCAAYRDQARDRVAARPDRAVPVVPSPSTDGLTALCGCEGMLRANYNAMNEQASAALKVLAPRLERARRELGEKCKTAAFDAQQAIEPFPVQFLRSQSLLDHCYAMSMIPR
jgi:hypothetical protein